MTVGACEPMTVAELTRRAAVMATRGGRVILGITGPPGAGKSTLAVALVEALGAGRAAYVGMDGFHLSNAVLERLGRRDRKGAIDTFDDRGYACLLARLARARPGDTPIYVPVFDRTLEEPIAAGAGVPAEVPLVVTEGNYLLVDEGGWRAARAQMGQVWYVDAPEPERLARLIARHEAYGKPPAQARAWALGSDQVNARLIATTMPRADLVVRVV